MKGVKQLIQDISGDNKCPIGRTLVRLALHKFLESTLSFHQKRCRRGLRKGWFIFFEIDKPSFRSFVPTPIAMTFAFFFNRLLGVLMSSFDFPSVITRIYFTRI